MSPKEILIAARKLIADENNWTQGAFARDDSGEEVPEWEPGAVCFCSVGAVSHAYRNNYQNQPLGSFYRDAFDALAKELKIYSTLADFNDNSTHQEVLALFDKAISNCQQ